MLRKAGSIAVGGCLFLVTAGCLPALPDNTTAGPPQRTIVAEEGDIVLAAEAGLEDTLWLEVPRPGGGTVGGYLSQGPSSRRSLVILLHGASTFLSGGSTAAARQFHLTRGQVFRDAGYRTFALDFQECGTAYGQAEVEDLVAFIDWLDANGKEILEVDRVYTYGYSVGATAAILANRQRAIAGVASISGLTQPDQFEEAWSLYYVAALIYSTNEGLCQLGTTLTTYGPPGSPGWAALDTVSQLHELKSPMLVVQGTEDQIYSSQNGWSLQAAYLAASAAGVALPPIEFLLLPGQDHFAPLDDPTATAAVLDFFERFSE